MQIVLKDDQIIASHPDTINVTLDMYPGATAIKIIPDSVSIVNPKYTMNIDPGIVQPDTNEPLFLKYSELDVKPEDIRSLVRIIDGGKITDSVVKELNSAETVDQLRNVISKILLGG